MAMKKERILAVIKSLACSQGFYGRVLEQIERNPKLLDELERQNFNDELDLIFYFEC